MTYRYRQYIAIAFIMLAGGCASVSHPSPQPFSEAQRLQRIIMDPQSTPLVIREAWRMMQATPPTEDPQKWIALADDVKRPMLPREVAMGLFFSRFMGFPSDLVKFVTRYHIEHWFTDATTVEIGRVADMDPLDNFLEQKNDSGNAVYFVAPANGPGREGFYIMICVNPKIPSLVAAIQGHIRTPPIRVLGLMTRKLTVDHASKEPVWSSADGLKCMRLAAVDLFREVEAQSRRIFELVRRGSTAKRSRQGRKTEPGEEMASATMPATVYIRFKM